MLSLKQHIKNNLTLAGPLIVSQIGHVITGMVDNIFLGRISIEAQDAGILCNNIFFLFLVFGIGMSQGLTPLISNAHVNNKNEVKASLLKNGIFLNLLIGCILSLLMFITPLFFNLLEQPEDVVELSIPFIQVLALSILPLTLFFIAKQFTEGLSNTKYSMFISISGNLLNIVLNYCLIYGKLGLPELGYMGSCWATFYSRLYMGIAFMLIVFKNKKWENVISLYKTSKIKLSELKLLNNAGIGPAFQYLFEVASFNIAAIMAGWIGKEALDAHGISLSLAAFSYMFGSGFSGSTSVLVSNHKGLGEWVDVWKATVSGYVLVFIAMGTMGLTFILFRNQLPHIFTDHANVIQISSGLLLIAAAFQLFDAAQVIGLGVARGLGDFKIPTAFTLVSYWIIALPLCYYFSFKLNYGVNGIWWGLTIGLAAAALSLFGRIQYVIKKEKNLISS